ncbi:ankyrin repeat-containing domain protein [Dactylonectria macrodidyma]|uniref:Ankyrin repeat-containing domain protein n=1 Tax=Dactylonectria macrodidyma TaxID=307937 RepID=A0A9P9CY04_9HYPO|nr:ankyrin repeat-containing domain protein [Dactylonectria macrodidyma]
MADNKRRTALFLASRSGYHDVVEVLITVGRIPLESTDWYGSTALFAAVRNGHADVVELLLAAGAMAFQVQDGFGRTLTWWARRTGNSGVLQLLVQHAKRTGSSIHDDLNPIGTISIPFSHESAWCDACTLSISDSSVCYCKLCDGGDFDLCAECFSIGIRCRNCMHVLLSRT